MKSLGLLSAAGAAFFGAVPAHAAWSQAEGSQAIKYTSVPGFFLQDDPATNPSGFDYASVNFGLIERGYPTDRVFDPMGKKTLWQRFEFYVHHLNRGCGHSKAVRYKVLFTGRHGQGWHNAAESYYGTPAWNCYWAELDGNGTAVWADALLTPAGAAQALKAHAFFRSQFATQKMPAPESYYTSPLSRCTATANLTFGGLPLPARRPFVPVVKELLREDISIHTCDRRSSRSRIRDMFPWYRFEDGFQEHDPLWKGSVGETGEAQRARSRVVLDDIFRSDDATWISITSHSGEISHLLTVLNHRPFGLGTGQIIPVLVKAEVVKPTPTTTFASWSAEATCTTPPVTSLADKGCVCPTATPEL